MINPPRTRRQIAAAATSLILLLTSACETQSGSGHRRPLSAGAIAVVPSRPATAALIGDRRSRTEMMVGAGITALPATAVVPYVDREEHDLRMRTAGTGIDLRRSGDEIILAIPSAIAFDPNGSVIRPGLHTTLDQLGRTLAQYAQGYVDVSGYAEAGGSDTGEVRLSQNRAQAVAAYLQMRGVAAARLGAKGFGASVPVAASDAGVARASNGRVEIRLVPLTEADVAVPVVTAAPNAAP
jgi:outer membrane protein OmpA-like peptidoglycan-associated protein